MHTFLRSFLLLSGFSCFSFLTKAQPGFTRTDTIQVFKNSTQLKNAWAGGHNFTQWSDIDLNFDGIKDLVVFDRSGSNAISDVLSTYLNTGTPNQVSYVHAPQYEKKFPFLHDWVLLIDYNCDGKEDIFTASGTGGISVYKNTSTSNNLQFALVVAELFSNYLPHNQNSYQKLLVSPSDIPGIVDLDNDGDLDIVTYELSGATVEHHKNLSVDSLGTCDSLWFWQDAACWGHFTEQPSNNTINLQSCFGVQNPDGDQNYRYSHDNPLPLHAGSCLTCLDMDGDLDKEALIGDISFCNINMTTNGGNLDTADMVAVDPNFPSSSVSVNQVLFPCPFHIDVNNDGKRDLIFSPNAPNVSENQTSILYYMNTGTDASPVFVYQQNDILQDGMIDVGEGAYPVFFDYDNDGLTDILIGNGYSKTGPGCVGGTNKVSVTAYKNTGTSTNPKFTFATSDFANLQSTLAPFRYYAPTFGDLDGDGDKDMIVGDENGKLHRFRNQGGVFTQVMPFNMWDNASNEIDVGQNAVPQLYDINKDSLIDIVVGERTGKLFYYKNIGTSTTPNFTLITSSLGNVDIMPTCCTGYSTPVLFSDSGVTELFVGSEQGYIYHYTNIDNNLAGTFTKVDSLLSHPSDIWEGIRVAPALGDVTGDGLIDMVVGNYRGGLAFYKGDLGAGIHNTYAEDPGMQLYPNPASGNVTIVISNADLRNASFGLYNFMGELVLEKRIDSPNSVIDVSALADGVYLCLVHSGNKEAVKKLVIKK